MGHDAEQSGGWRRAFEVPNAAPLPPKRSAMPEVPAAIYCVRCLDALADDPSGACASCGLAYNRSDASTFVIDPSPAWVKTTALRCAEVALVLLVAGFVLAFIVAPLIGPFKTSALYRVGLAGLVLGLLAGVAVPVVQAIGARVARRGRDA